MKIKDVAKGKKVYREGIEYVITGWDTYKVWIKDIETGKIYPSNYEDIKSSD